jgi:hypothetical protein
MVLTYNNSTVVKLGKSKTDFLEMEQWLLENCTGEAELHMGGGGFGPRVLFEKEEDATLFALRWGG